MPAPQAAIICMAAAVPYFLYLVYAIPRICARGRDRAAADEQATT